MSQKVQIYRNTNSKAGAFGKYFVRAVYDDKFITTNELADYIQSQATVKQLDAVQTTSIETRDSARAEVVHNSNVFSYDDRWSHLEFSLDDSTFYYNIRDSLATVVYHDYKHRILWGLIKWGIKGYKVKIVNFNPHARVTYNRYVQAEK